MEPENMFELLPKVLYKYRDWNNLYHKKILTENQIFFSSRIGFNDPFDASIPFRYDEKEMTPDNIFKKLYETGKEFMPDLSDEELIQKCYEQQNSGIFEKGTYWKNQYDNFVEKVNNTFGILSLTTKNSNLLMWSHYANSHRGFCIGFNTEKLFKLTRGTIGPVIYDNKMPFVPLFDREIEGITKLLNTKSKEWEYEDEYRMVKSLSANKTFEFEENLIEEVILGLNMDDKNKTEVIDIVKQKFPETKLYEATKDLDEFKLNIIPIF